MKLELKAALISGAVGLTVSFLLNYFVIPVPETELANAFGNGFAQNAVTFCHMEDKEGADVILIVAIIVRE